MKAFLVTLLVCLALLFILLLTYYGWSLADFGAISLEDQSTVYDLAWALGIIGIPLSFIGLILVTGSGRMFTAVGYTFKHLFRRYRQKYDEDTYYDYTRRQKTIGGLDATSISILVIGLVFFALSLYMGELWFSAVR